MGPGVQEVRGVPAAWAAFLALEDPESGHFVLASPLAFTILLSLKGTAPRCRFQDVGTPFPHRVLRIRNITLLRPPTTSQLGPVRPS